MALGKNMKIDRLIPLKRQSEKQNEKAGLIQNEKEELDLEKPISVSLDDFFGELDSDSVGSIVTDHPDINQQIIQEEIIAEPIQVIEAIQTEKAEEPDPIETPTTPYEDIVTDSIKIVFTPSRRKTQKRILITIEGDLTIKNVEMLYSKVNNVFANYDFVEVTLTNVTEIDLTIVQLFHAIRVSYYPQQKFIAINAEFSRDDRKMLNTCGFTEFQTQKTA